ncbi:L-lactate dehydrogenase complex protein LldG [Desulfatibacillum alkenivorans DSM 16219]|uniref:L-lactate dehydrogenase complex protein LldG n=1 Tax=Desulfatibacillum alkenivorans DSM 16219 TaxID=1121393 RepID=A0A1M6L1E4_9BACT|nr:lactate utilization protein [Desulfatibacillum alkenivorans]SHJ65017.1 L-lactate dehydrogenase complex protein LldG [Desulfatibacillum alkenivorans DSM 16219]
MLEGNRDKILNRLKKAPQDYPPGQPCSVFMPDENMDREQMVEKFKTLLEAQTGVLHRVKDKDQALEALAGVLKEEGVAQALASTDQAVADLDLPAWGKGKGVEITTHKDYSSRDDFKKAAFETVQAGITGADYGFSETGTLCLLASEDMPRLLSLAPIIHIAVLPLDRLKPTYEHMVREVFNGGAPPSQTIFITGPSMTADIQATPFKGMHGPQKLFVILRES